MHGYWFYRNYFAKVEVSDLGYAGTVTVDNQVLVAFQGRTEQLARATFWRAIDALIEAQNAK